MKILVVGGAGYVGGVIVDLLLKKKKITKLQYLIIFYTKIALEKIVILFLET